MFPFLLLRSNDSYSTLSPCQGPFGHRPTRLGCGPSEASEPGWVKPWSFCVLAAQAVTRYIASSSKLLRRSNGAKNINVSFLDEVVCVTLRWRNSFDLRQLFNQGSVDIQDTITTLLNLSNFGISDELLISSAK